jgi:Nucleotidyltransferase domain
MTGHDGAAPDPHVLACQCADDLMAAGADAVALVGSVAVATAGRWSDIDLVAVTDLPGSLAEVRQQVRGGRVVNVDVVTDGGVRDSFASIPAALAVVPGWQHADILSDPTGVARALADEAASWTFAGRTDDIGRWAAGTVTGLAEELVKSRHLSSAAARAVNSVVIALQLSGPMVAMAERHYRSENELWDLAAEVMGPEWALARDRVLGLDRTPDPGAAARLYTLAVQRADPWLTPSQRQVVDLARSAAD